MKLYMATIDFEDGTNFYASTTPEGLTQQLFDYVTEYWSELNDPDLHIEHCRDKGDAIEIYFDGHPSESITYGDVEVEGIEAVQSSSDKLWSEFECAFGDYPEVMDAISTKLDELGETESSRMLSRFNEVSYDGDAGHDYLNTTLQRKLLINPAKVSQEYAEDYGDDDEDESE